MNYFSWYCLYFNARRLLTLTICISNNQFP